MTASGATKGLHHRMLSLGVAGMTDYLLGIVTAIALARLLHPDAFGQYRLFWLTVNTAMVFAPMYLPQSLLYFIPRAERAGAVHYVTQTLLALAATGLVAACVVVPGSPFVPQALQKLGLDGWLLPVFLWAWVASSMVEWLPNADRDITRQARLLIMLSVLRALAVTGSAWLGGGVAAVLLALLFYVVVRFAMMLHYVLTRHGFRPLRLQRALLVEQFRYALPFGVAGALYMLRGQAEQWVVALLFSLREFAAFSIALVVAPLVTIVRRSVANAVMPDLSRAQKEGRMAEVLALSRRGTRAVSLLLFPMLGFLFVFAEQVVELVYTRAYIEAAQVMRVVLVGMLPQTLELNSLIGALSQGRFLLGVSAALLGFSASVSYLGATKLGLAGAALGSVAAMYAETWLSLRRLSALTGVAIARMQDWGWLMRCLAVALLAAAAAYLLVGRWFRDSQVWMQLALGGATLFVIYAVGMVPAWNWRRREGMAKGDENAGAFKETP